MADVPEKGCRERRESLVSRIQMTDTALQKTAHDTSFAVLMAIGLCHLLNDLVQSLLPAMMVGLGSAVFHPEASRVARMASGGRYGLAQSVFQVGGNTGQAISPLTAAALVATYGQRSIIWYAGLALFGILVLFQIGTW